MPASQADLRGRDMLDEPPRKPRLRSRASGGALSALAGSQGEPPPVTPGDADEDINSPDGELTESDPSQASDLDSHPVVQAFDHAAQAFGHLEIVGTIMPQLLMPVQDLITLIKQMLPEAAAAMLSGSPLGGAPSASPMAGAPSPLSAGGPSPMGLQQLAGGGGAGMMGGGGMGAPAAMTPPGMM